MLVSIKLNGVEKLLKKLDPKAQDKIATRTVSKVAAQAKTAADKEIRKDYRIKKKDLKLTLHKAVSGTAIAVIKGSRRSISLAKFSARQLKAGTRVEAKRGEKKVFSHAFISTMSTGYKGVFIRAKKGDKRVSRLPVKEIYGPSPGQLLKRPETIKAINKLVNLKFKKILHHEMKYYFEKHSR